MIQFQCSLIGFILYANQRIIDFGGNRCALINWNSSMWEESPSAFLQRQLCSCFDIFPELFRILFFLMKIIPKICIYIIQFGIYKYICKRFFFVTTQTFWGLPHFISCWYILGKCKLIFYSTRLHKTELRRQIYCYESKGKCMLYYNVKPK